MRAGYLRVAAALAAVPLAVLVGCDSSTPPPEGSSRSDLRAFLRSDDPAARVEAAETLAVDGPDAAWAVPALAACLEDTSEAARDPTVRQTVLLALGWIGPEAASALAAVRPLMTAAPEDVRRAAVEATGQIAARAGPEVREDAGATLVRALNDPAAPVRRAAAMAVGRIERTRDAPRLAEMVRADPDPMVRQDAARALGWMGAALDAPQARALAPTLAHAVEGADPETAVHAAEALRKVAPLLGPDVAETVAPALMAGLAGQADLVDPSAEALGRLGPALKSDLRRQVEAALQQAATRGPSLSRETAARALETFRESGPPPLP